MSYIQQGKKFPQLDLVKEEQPAFPTNANAIAARLQNINAVAYSKTRNFFNGAVTYLSAYISRGFITLPEVRDIFLKKHKLADAFKLLQELAWREYFQRVWQAKGDEILNDIRHTQPNVQHYTIPDAIINAQTQIEALNQSVHTLYTTGYMHNHARMYTAMLTCNIARSHWLTPAKWMYYHLLDGDIASNMLSWQWVAGSFSSKKYFANQENINKYSGTIQTNTYLDTTYDQLQEIPIPVELQQTSEVSLTTELTAYTQQITIDKNKPLLVYNSYNIDPNWYKSEDVNRVLLLEPAHFEKYPVSNKVINFIVGLAKENIPNVQIAVCSFKQLTSQYNGQIIFKEHPLAKHYTGKEEPRAWLFPEVSGYYPSFSAYWKKCERYVRYS
ncbi:MAG: deoxyribodipyrimidine photolyase [Bacteroidota bacterium]|nr:deoxyribodipyrimidine photolyase [Bacteroidota bacterium]